MTRPGWFTGAIQTTYFSEQFHLRLKRVTVLEKWVCCSCGGEESKRAFSAFDFDHSAESFELLQCMKCGLAQTWPPPDHSSIDQYYSNSYYGSAARKFSGIVEYLTVLENRLRAERIFKALGKVTTNSGSVRILDIGCGRANLLRSLKSKGCECFGIERKEYPSDDSILDIKIYRSSLEERKFEDSFFDAVIIWHVLEHLYEPFITLDEVSRITRPGGIVAIAVPNFSSLQSRWFKSNWFHLDLPRHLFHFDVDNLGRALTQRGFVIQSVSTCSLGQNLFGFIQSLMNSSKFPGKPNEFYQLLKNHSGVTRTLKLMTWLFVAILMFPFALVEFVISCILKKGASVVIFARKA